MRILALTQNDVATPRYGGALRVAALTERLRASGADLEVIRFRRAADPASPHGAGVHDIVVPGGYLLPPVAALAHLGLRAAERLALRLHHERPFDLIQSDPPWAALTGERLARQLGLPHVLLAQNCETVLAARISATGPGRRVPLVGPLLADANVQVVRWAERRAVGSAVVTLTPAETDRTELASVGITTERVRVLPNGTMVRPRPEERGSVRLRLGLRADTPAAIFVGRMDYPPNREAVDLICGTIAPRLPAVRFLLVGLNPPRIELPANVQMVGAVERVDEYLSAADLAVVPVLRGSGTRIKILDAWAAGLPVLATSAAAAGLCYTDGRDILIEEQVERFPARIEALLADAPLRTALSVGGLNAARPYSWDQIGQSYVAALRAVAGEA